jgi:MinD-like ATPase involved in chromosome partitioning or flagellar assembly
MSTVLAVVAARPGSGATTVAAGLAVAAHARGMRVCVVDLDMDGAGDLAAAFGVANLRGFGTLMTPGTRFEDAVTNVQYGLDCVLGPDRPGEGQRIPLDVVGDVLLDAAVRYDLVVVDTDARMSGPTQLVLDLASQTVLVSTEDAPTLVRARAALDVLDLLRRRRPRRFVLNRTDESAVLDPEQVDSIVRVPVDGIVPFSHDVIAAVNHGSPLSLTAPDHPVSAALARLCERCVEPDETGCSLAGAT